MRKPKRSDDKYWEGTRNFNHIQFESDLEDYIIYLESEVEHLHIADVSISLERAKKYARHQHFLGTQGKELVEFDDWKAKD